MTRHYATAPREREFATLVASMDRHCWPYTLHVLCWDWWPAKRPPPHITCVSREAFLRARPEYAPERLPGPPRRPVDQVCTARWRFALGVLDLTGEPVTLIDGDQWFFSSPEPMFAEIPANAPLAVSPHRIPPRAAGLPGVCLETHAQYGEFNGGFSFWRDPAALAEMAAATHAWSYTEVRQHPVDGLPDFGDQGSLERVARRRRAHVIQHPGVNLAPWNIHGVKLIERSGMVLVDRWPVVDCRPLVTYHFSSLRLTPDGTPSQLADPHYEVERAPGAAELVYRPYLRALREG
jgi:hypothetical protein